MAQSVGGGPIVPVVFWPGSGSATITGKTAFGLYDDDDVFAEDAPKVAKWVCSSLGYPVVSIELTDEQIYKQFEYATMEFTSIVNEFNMRENLLNIQGMPTGSSISQKLIRSTPVPYIVKVASDYGTEAMSGGTVDIKRGYITMQELTQEYDLQSLWAAVSESGNRIEIRRVFHERVPAMQRFYDPFAGTGGETSWILGAFGWSNYSVPANFTIMPVYETLLRAQAIELNDQIRRAQYSFEIRNNKLKLYPVPSSDDAGDRVWFEYNVEIDKFGGADGSGRIEQGVVSDYSNAPFSFVPYTDINDVGRRWIYQYTLSSCKVLLGQIRSKYESMPIPNNEVRLDGTTLRQEGYAELEKLAQFLRETLEQAGRHAQLEKQKENEMNMHQIMKLIPLPIYIG